MRASVNSFTSWDGIEIAYRLWGEHDGGEPPVVLHHGFAADSEVNWVRTGVVDALLASGRRVIAPDARGHGRSEKPHDPGRYGEQRMARDLGVLLDLLAAPAADLVGYSMGAVVCLLLAAQDPRVRRLVIGGVGSGVIECGGVDRRAISDAAITAALSVPDPATIADRAAAGYRAVAEAAGADLEALVAQARSRYSGGVALARISAPTLLLAGDADPLAVRPEALAAAMPDARLQLLAGDHMTAVVDPRFAAALSQFLA